MRFASVRLVTEDVGRLAAFYSELLAVPSQGDASYVELRPGGAVLALVSRRAAEPTHGGEWPAASNRSAILEFETGDVDAERRRLEGLVGVWLQEPTSMPWGNRAMILRDPDGHPVNIFDTRGAVR